ncbi:MAG: serine/threonine protein kinase, partial [Candidatus Obscuribacterales bacterium]|nr:serine/threonine protein kinase [Steroidobacteraceae bacterium]
DREGDAVFMTMELLRGRSLENIVTDVRGRGVGRAEAWRIVRGIAEGLAYAHRKGIVHSDLKPGNVFLLDDGQPKILDFGIARAVPTAESSVGGRAEPRDTFDAGKLGAYTEAYATSEMIAGIDPHPADDIYALGLIAYELLSGAHPFNRLSSVKAQSLHLKMPALKGLRRRERRTLERCLSFERGERPRNAGEFLRDLSGVTRLQQTLVAATVILTLLASYFGYSSYREAGPAVSFAQLSSEVQQQFQTHMGDGDQLWRFYEQDHNMVALQEAVEQYAAAYQLHPRNRDAARALKKSADAALAATKDNPEQQREFAKMLAERSDYLAKYPPVRSAGE